MLTGTFTAAYFLLVQLASTVGLTVSSVLALPIGVFMGWWSARFAVRYGNALALQYSIGLMLDEGWLLRRAAGPLLVADHAKPGAIPQLRHVLGRGAPAAIALPAAAGLGIVASLLAVRFGFAAPFWCCLAAVSLLLALAIIDGQTSLLPDTLTLPLLWMGLLVSWVPDVRTIDLYDAVAGAAAGYGVLTILFVVYRYLRKQEGMGRGDFKLMAALGAWFGWQLLPALLLMACLLSVAYVIGCKPYRSWQTAYPFGPFLVIPAIYIIVAPPALHFYIW